MAVSTPGSVAITLLLVSTVSAGACSRGPAPYAALNQAVEQEVPGTLGYSIAPPGDAAPTADPDEVYPTLLGASPGRDVSLTFAVVRNEADGIEYGPSWVFITRDLCYFNAKGDFVSPSRAGKKDGCTPNNMLVQVVDADTGDLTAALDAYDAGDGWRPDTAGGSVQPAVSTRFH